MPIVKCSILVLLQFISYCFYVQNTSKIILGKTLDYQAEILSEEHLDRTNNILADVESTTEGSKSLVKLMKTTPSASSKHNRREDGLGLNWSIGFGIGYSSHASSYSFDDGLRIKEFSGFRSIVMDTKIGWRFYERVAIFGTWKYSPNNAIISPYRSNYLGGGVSYYFGDSQQFSVHGGLGRYQAKVERNEVFGNGLLVNYGMILRFTNNFGFELNVLVVLQTCTFILIPSFLLL